MFKTNSQSAYKVRSLKFRSLRVTFKRMLEKITTLNLTVNKYKINLIFNWNHWLLIMKENSKHKNHFNRNLSKIKMREIQKSKELTKYEKY